MGPEHGFGLFHLVAFLIGIAIYAVPAIKIIQKAGYSGWWFLVSFVPLVNLIMLWVFAFAEWPNVKRSETR